MFLNIRRMGETHAPPTATMILPFMLETHTEGYGWRKEQLYVTMDALYGAELIKRERVHYLYNISGWYGPEVCIVGWCSTVLHWEMVGKQLHLYLVENEETTVEVRVIQNSTRTWKRTSPNPRTCFKIQNTCGAWVFPMEMNTKRRMNVLITTTMMKRTREEMMPHEFKKNGPPRRKKRNMRHNCIQQDSLHSISGTYVVSNMSFKVPFRGVRGYDRMLEDWLLVLGNHNEKRMVEEVRAIYLLLNSRRMCDVFMLAGNHMQHLHGDPKGGSGIHVRLKPR